MAMSNDSFTADESNHEGHTDESEAPLIEGDVEQPKTERITGGTPADSDSQMPAGEGEPITSVIAMPSLDEYGNETHRPDAIVLGSRPEADRGAQPVELASEDTRATEVR